MNIPKILPNEVNASLRKGIGTNFSHEYKNYAELIPSALLHSRNVNNSAANEYGRVKHLPNVVLEKQPAADKFFSESTIA